MVKVLGLGDNVCDVYLHTGTMYPGGQAVNFAVYARQLGAQADFMGVFGQDAVARRVQRKRLRPGHPGGGRPGVYGQQSGRRAPGTPHLF